ncbi:hypothetical protein [uncultured Clostridium sp.]|uniref:hypothetical protein n=1 Tax=uncultured Clostridium sp. TaxID=59620 RepID=UPI0025EC50F0|nr:hypothetical protein [uncultured Clostridium sp.]
MRETFRTGEGSPLPDAPIGRLLSVLRPLLLMIPLIHILSRFLGLNGVLFASPATNLLSSLACFVIRATRYLWSNTTGM